MRFFLLSLVVFTSPVSAQWLNYPTPNIPRKPNGEPDLSAPAPRTAEGKPDLSGIWRSAERKEDCAGEDDCIAQLPLPLDQLDIARSLPDGLPFQPWAQETVERRVARNHVDDPHARCLPPTFPRAYSLPEYYKIVQTPDLLVMLDEFNASYRQIFLDGRPLPVDPNPTWNGYSTGHWEDDTLVVETIGFRDGTWLDWRGTPLTEQGRIVERFRRTSFGTLAIDVTVDDPKAYTEPWSVTLEQEIVVDTQLLDDICMENEQDVELDIESVTDGSTE